MIQTLGVPDGCIYKIKRPKQGGLPGFHFGLVLGDGSVVDFGYETHIRICDAYTFAAGLDVTVISRIPESEQLNVHRRLQLAFANPAAYDFWKWNCENFVNFLVGEEARSDQVRWLELAAVVSAVAALAKFAKVAKFAA